MFAENLCYSFPKILSRSGHVRGLRRVWLGSFTFRLAKEL